MGMAMRKIIMTTMAAAALAVPMSLSAQEAVEIDEPIHDAASQDFSGLAERMQDPDTQRELALMARAMGEVLLDLPIAPLIAAAGEVSEDLTGKDLPSVDPDATLRKIAPFSSRAPEEIERNLPRALNAMGSMAKALETMAPTLKDMAARMKTMAPQAD